MLLFFAKASILFFVQSNIFLYILRKKNEDTLFIWDIYLGTNVIAFVCTITLGSILKVYFPLYILSLFITYYGAYLLFLRMKKAEDIRLYLGINIYVAFVAHLIFVMNTDLVTDLFMLSVLGLCILLLLKKKMHVGIYLIPLLYYLSIIVLNTSTIDHIILLFRHEVGLSWQIFSQIWILVILGLVMVMEFIFARVSIHQNKDLLMEEYESILRYRNIRSPQSQSSFVQRV